MFPSIIASGNAYFANRISAATLLPYKQISKIRPVPNNTLAVSNVIKDEFVSIKKETIYNTTLK